MPTRCTATTSRGTPCKAWAVRGTDPPRCAAHGGGKRPVGAPRGNKNAEKHGAYSSPPPAEDLDVRIADLGRKIDQLSRYIDDRFHKLEPKQLRSLLALHGQLSSRLGRLQRDRRQIRGDEGDDRINAIDEALDRLAREWGIEL